MTVGPFCTKVSCLLCHWASHYTLCLILLVHPMEALFLIKNSNTFIKILTSYRIIYRVSWKACYWWSTAAYKTSYHCLCSLQVGFCLTAPFKHMCLSHHQPWLMLKVIETLAYYVKDIDLHLQWSSIKCIIIFSYYKRRLLISSKCLLSGPINCPEVYSLSSRQYC